MLTFFSFIIVLIGSFNWFFIAAFQYDFIAGFFGSQASLFSRFIYFAIGMASFVLIAMAFKNKGSIKITENSFKLKKIKKHQAFPEKKEEFEEIPLTQNFITPDETKFPIQEENQEGYKDFDVTKYDN